MKTLYVTSFSKRLYDTTGKTIIETFSKINPHLDLLVCYEEFDFQSKNPNIIPYNLKDSSYLNNWLKKYKDIIPEMFGGNAVEGKSSKEIFTFWNIRASRWFRKIASLEIALNQYGNKYQSIVWIDCDSKILKRFPDNLIENIFYQDGQEYDVFYHLGTKRAALKTGIESGVIGFREGLGYQYLKKVFDIFEDGSFQKFERWDDGYVFKIVINACLRNKLLKAVDIIDEKHILNRKTPSKLDAINKGVFKDYILHLKGSHVKNGVLG